MNAQKLADTLEPAFEKARAQIGDKAENEEDILSYALFPEQALKFFNYREGLKKRTFTYSFSLPESEGEKNA